MKIDIQDTKVNSRLVLWSYIFILLVIAPIGVVCWHKWHSLWAFAPSAITFILWFEWSNKLDRIRMKRYEEMQELRRTRK